MSTHTASAMAATWVGVLAIISWAMLPLLSALAGGMPPFLLTGICFALTFSGCLLWWAFRRVDIRPYIRMPLWLWAFGTVGYFGFHFCYFFALRNAPPLEAFLVIETWPILMVLLAPLLLKTRLQWNHVLGAVVAFSGVLVMKMGGGTLQFEWAHWPGFACAVAAAFIWSAFSVLSRRFEARMTQQAVAMFCGSSAVASLLCAALFEPVAMPTLSQWGWLALMALGPVGGSFFVWNIGMKYGHFHLLAIGSFSIPLMGAVLLSLFSYAEMTPALLSAAGLLTVGSLIGAADTLRRKPKTITPVG